MAAIAYGCTRQVTLTRRLVRDGRGRATRPGRPHGRFVHPNGVRGARLSIPERRKSRSDAAIDLSDGRVATGEQIGADMSPHALAIVHAEAGVDGIAFPDLPGCIAAGDSLDDVLQRGAAAAAACVDSLNEDGEPIPCCARLTSAARPVVP